MKAISTDNYAAFLKEMGKSNSTISTYVSQIKCFDLWLTDKTGSANCEEIDSNTLLNYQSYLMEKNLSLQTIRLYCFALKSFSKFLMLSNIVAKPLDINTFTSEGDSTTVYTMLDEPVLRKVLRRVHDLGNPRDISIIYLLHNGLKTSELLMLSDNDIRLSYKTTIYLKSLNKVPRCLTVKDEVLIKALLDYMMIREKLFPKSNRIFLSNSGRPLSRSGVYSIIKKYAYDLSVTPKDFRRRAIFNDISSIESESIAEKYDLSDFSIKRYRKTLSCQERKIKHETKAI